MLGGEPSRESKVRSPWAPQAELAERDFAGERGQVVVISTGAAVDPKAEAQTAVERRAAEDRNRHRCLASLSARVCNKPAPSRLVCPLC